MLQANLIGSLFLIASIQLIRADYYSSTTGLENLLKLETFMIGNLETYLNSESLLHLKLRKYIENSETELAKTKNDSVAYFGNPLNAWKAIKRVTREWQDFYLADINNRNKEEYIKRIVNHETTSGIRRPNDDDLGGAARGIARLQRTYNLETIHLANGTIMGRKVSYEMSAVDCYDLGMSLINSTDFKNGAMWLLEARGRLALETQAAMKRNEFIFPYLQDNTILDNLVPAVMQNGNTKLAFWLIKEQLARNPQNEKALENYKFIEEQLRNERIAMERGVEEQAIEQPSSLTEMYEKTCSGEIRQTPTEQRDLRCSYTHNNVSFCLIAPFKLEVLSIDPYVAYYHEAIYENEIKSILNATEDKVERSKVGGGHSFVSDTRTSKQSWLWYDKHEFLAPIAQRLTDITGLSLYSAEALQVANYGIGGHYGPHYDFFEADVDVFSERGNRILTALFYINNVEFGGATAFPFLKIAVPPIRRSLVLWYNLHRSLELDFRMKHAGCPVIKGSKWICNEWYHTMDQEFKRPCGLKPEGYISLPFKAIV